MLLFRQQNAKQNYMWHSIDVWNGTNRSKLHARRNEALVNSGNAYCLSAHDIRLSAQETEAVLAV